MPDYSLPPNLADQPARIAITGARVIDPASRTDRAADLFIDTGRIVAIGAAPHGFAAQRSIDASGCWVLPGLVDLAARLREPGFEYRATLESEMRAALAGGVTSLACPPDTDPPLDEPGLVQMLKHRARTLNQARLYPVGALTVGLKGAHITEMAELAEAGCVGFSHAMAPLVDTQVLVRAMQYAHTFGFTIWLHAQDAYLARGGVAHSGAVAGRMGLPGVPVMAETVALHTIFEAVRATGCRVHLCRLSSAAGIELVRRAKREGLPVTADVAVHHLHLIDVDIGFYDPNCRVDPPFRAQRDRDALRQAAADGTLDAICSDHTPVDDDAKQLPFGEAEPGVTAVELLLPLTLKWAREAGVSPVDALARITSQAAAVLGAADSTRQPAAPTVADAAPSGALRVGGAADVCVLDPDAHWVCGPRTLLSQGSHTPFSGVELAGQVRATLVGGRIAFER